MIIPEALFEDSVKIFEASYFLLILKKFQKNPKVPMFLSGGGGFSLDGRKGASFLEFWACWISVTSSDWHVLFRHPLHATLEHGFTSNLPLGLFVQMMLILPSWFWKNMAYLKLSAFFHEQVSKHTGLAKIQQEPYDLEFLT